MAKGLAGGFPIGACLAGGEAAELLQPGNHGTTFGGNPVASAAALAVIRTIDDDGLLDHATKLGERLRSGLGDDERVTEVRGSGLLVGLDLTEEKSAQVFAAALEAGFIVNNPTPGSRPPGAPARADRRAGRVVPGRLARHPRRGVRIMSAATRHFLRDDDLSPVRPGGGARPRPEAQGLAVRRPRRWPGPRRSR